MAGTLLCLRSSVIVTLHCRARSLLNSLSNFGQRAREKIDDIYVIALCCSYVCVWACELERSLIFIWRTLTGKTDISECAALRVIAIALCHFLKMSVKLW